MYPEKPAGIQVIVGSMNMGYISDTARNRTHNLFRPEREPIPLGHSDEFWVFIFFLNRIQLMLTTWDLLNIIHSRVYRSISFRTWIKRITKHLSSLFNFPKWQKDRSFKYGASYGPKISSITRTIKLEVHILNCLLTRVVDFEYIFSNQSRFYFLNCVQCRFY